MYMYNELLSEIVRTRRHFHMHPETGFKEFRTSEFIKSYLQGLGIEVMDGIAGTGVIGIIRGEKGTSSVAIRADMDCLEVTEQTGAEYSSKMPGLMHACGHDGHMSALLGLAKLLKLADCKLNNDILLIFQPAEEGPGGAKVIVESGVLDNYNIKAILGMHIFPEVDKGRIGCCPGPITARNGELDIIVQGESCHGALPNKGIDSIIAASSLIQSLQTIVSRRIDPRENAVVTIGKMFGGEARNIVAGSISMEGTIRAFSEQIYNHIKKCIYDICEGTNKAYGCNIKTEIRDMYPEVYNDAALYDILVKAAGIDSVDILKPLMIAEDFSYYRSVAPELMFLLGSRDTQNGHDYPLHNAKFDFDEAILLKAVHIFKNMICLLD